MRRVLHLLITLTALGGGAAAAQQAAERVHTVQAGETLSSIALSYLGSVGSWRQIYEANRDRIPDPDRIEAGLELRIPAAGAAGGSGRRSIFSSCSRSEECGMACWWLIDDSRCSLAGQAGGVT